MIRREGRLLLRQLPRLDGSAALLELLLSRDIRHARDGLHLENGLFVRSTLELPYIKQRRGGGRIKLLYQGTYLRYGLIITTAVTKEWMDNR